jgi:hypothetical protein
MVDDLILSFPVLKNGGGYFLNDISYVVEAATQEQNNRKLYITHTLKGNSFISKLIKDKKAKFFVSLLYRDNAERQKFICDEFNYDNETNEITAEQEIKIDFRYAPEVTPNIVVFENDTITVDNNSGLSDFWNGEIFTIPAYARIAHYSKLKFTSGDTRHLLSVNLDENFNDGSIKTTVSETAGESEQPIKITCAKDVFDELNKGVDDKPYDAKTAMRASIVTQVLCCVYSDMGNLSDKETEINSGLLLHMETVKEKTQQDWKDDSFNPSLAATQMIPYAIKALNKEDN